MAESTVQGMSLLPRVEGVNLEGPFLTLEEFLFAQKIREELHAQQHGKGKKKSKKKVINQPGAARTFDGSVDHGAEGETFILTTTGNEEMHGESSNDELPSGSMSRNSMASTATGVRHTADSRAGRKRLVSTKNQGVQCGKKREKKDEDVDTILRRYYFNLEWEGGSLGPGLLASAQAGGPIRLPSVGGEKENLDQEPAGRPVDENTNAINEGQAQLDRPKSSVPQVKKELSATRSLGSRPPRAPSAARARSPSPQPGGGQTPNIDMRFYEVKLLPEEAEMNLDYTVDYRRFSYTDFKLDTDANGGQSNIKPELLTAWIQKAIPRNQDDVYPLFILCRDLLKKFHQKEMRYIVKKQDHLEEEIQGLHQALLEEKDLHTQTVQKSLGERESWQADKAAILVKFGQMEERLKDFDALEKELNDMKDQFDPSIFDELRALEEEMGILTTENSNLKGQQSALRTLQEVMKAREVIAKKTQEKLGKDLEETRAAKEDAELRYQSERARLVEITAELNALKAKTPYQHAEEWDPATKAQLLKMFLSVEGLTDQLRIDDVAMIAPGSQRNISKMLMRLMKLLTAAAEQEQCEESKASWVEAISSTLSIDPNNLYYNMMDAIKKEEVHYKTFINNFNVSQNAPVWEMVREAMDASGVKRDDLAALQLISGIDKDELFQSITGLQKDDAELMTQNFDQFKKWFDRFGNNPSGLDDAAVEAMRETEKRRKYGLFDEQTLSAVPYTEKETLAHIANIFDHKVETDYRNEKDQKPRANMVKTVRSYMLKKYTRKREADHNLERFCTSVIKHKDTNVRIKTFGILSGLTDTNHWTERSVCFLFCYLQELKSMCSPGNESKNPADLGTDWVIYREWLGTEDFVVESDHVVQAARIASDSKFGFGTLNNLTRALTGAEVEKEGFTDPLSFDMATAILLDLWFEQFDTAKAALRVLFDAFDVDGDEVLELSEFIELVKSTPMKIRQHDAINMFHELAGPDDTMDQGEFAELLTFYKFNTRTLLTTMEATQRQLARRNNADEEGEHGEDRSRSSDVESP